jgi:ribosome-associated translation inhibitor RaiA
VPAYIRSVEVALNAEDRAHVRRKLGTKLGKFVRSIERVSVRVEDVNGPRGGVDTACRIKVVLSGLPSVVVEEQSASLHAAIDRSFSRTERAVRRSVQRRRTTSPYRQAISRA